MNNPIDINVLYALNQQGVKILHINERYYMTEFWEPATTTMLQHKMEGRDITAKLISAMNVVGNPGSAESVVMGFQSLPKHTICFHGSIPYTFYQDTKGVKT